MALSPSISYTTETPDGESYQGTITDATVYGAPEATRASVAVYITGEKINADGTVDHDVTFDTYDPETEDAFTFDIEEDGWYKFLFAIIPDYNALTAYVEYDAVYSGGVVYRATGATTGNAPPDVNYWEVIATPTDLIDNDGEATESLNLIWQQYEQIIYPYAKECFGDKVEEAALECCSTCDRSESVLDYEFIGVLVDGMKAANTRSRYASGEKLARKAAEFAAQ